jgi:hypothetical protein
VPLHLSISNITFSNGDTVALPSRGVVVFVGPNNAGKTAALRETLSQLRKAGTGKVITTTEFVFSGSEQDGIDWLKENCHCDNESFATTYSRGDRKYMEMQSEKLFKKLASPHPRELGDIAKVLTVFLNAEERLAAAKSVDAHDPRTEAARYPMQELLMHRSVEEEVREEAKLCFGEELILDRTPGKRIYAKWGDSSNHTPDALRAPDLISPLLDDQGDGLRSFIGTLIHLRLAKEFIVAIDEPEAFLHPPQARRLGKLVVSLAQSRQVFVATHSIDFIRGLLDSGHDDVTIIHLRRNGGVNVPHVLKSDEFATTWSDPLLRYSNILDGLFHDKAVLCESEVDCRFYHAVFDQLIKSQSRSGIAIPTILFIYAGGKSGFGRAADALAAFGIPTRVIADFDALNEEHILKELVKILGGAWSDLQPTWKIVQEAVNKKGAAPPQISDVKEKFNAIIAGKSGRLDQATSKKLIEALQYPSAWADAKRAGRSVIPSGQESVALEALLTQLKSVGIFVVPVGEVECWIRRIGGKSMAWLNNVFVEVRSGTNPFDSQVLEFVAEAIGLDQTSTPAIDKKSHSPATAKNKPHSPQLANKTEKARSTDENPLWRFAIVIALLLSLAAFLRTF